MEANKAIYSFGLFFTCILFLSSLLLLLLLLLAVCSSLQQVTKKGAKGDATNSLCKTGQLQIVFARSLFLSLSHSPCCVLHPALSSHKNYPKISVFRAGVTNLCLQRCSPQASLTIYRFCIKPTTLWVLLPF